MISASRGPWLAANQTYLLAELERVRRALAAYAALTSGEPPGPSADAAPTEASASGLAPPALSTLCAAYGLSPFERDVLLLCAGVELDAGFRALVAQAQGPGHSAGQPTLGLSLSALAEPHWSALAPRSPLRRARLVELSGGEGLTGSALRIDERVLHYLTGVSSLDERLAALLRPVTVPAAESLPPSLHRVAARLCEVAFGDRGLGGERTLLWLDGPDAADRRGVAATAAATLGVALFALRAADVPHGLSERELLGTLWEREGVLGGAALLLCCDDSDPPEVIRSALGWIERLPGLLFGSSREPVRTSERRQLSLTVPRPSFEERRTLLLSALADAAAAPGAGETLADGIDQVAVHFRLGREELAAACALARARVQTGATSELAPALWDECLQQARPRLDTLARRIRPSVRWEDLVLPELHQKTLRELIAHQRQQLTVYYRWGMAGASARGLGVTALFVGQSGTGKTLAAEVLARELRLDLYHIDLSQLISKYIGETEKNLRRVFDAAEEGGAVLLFDEADALFGKRSEVKDSHDRYANIEVSYLLQRMEAYQGISVLTSNQRSALDSAFLRRIRFILQFPFPDAAQRAELWRRAFPAGVPTHGLAIDKLARLPVTGGQIRNIALAAAFLAAEDGQPVGMRHLALATRSEYGKNERPLTDADLGGWA